MRQASLALFLLPLTQASAQDVEVPPATLRPLERVAVELKKATMRLEQEHLLAVLKECGYPARAMVGLEDRLAKTRPSERSPRYDDLARQVEKVAAKVAELLTGLPEAQRAGLARQVLLLDGEIAEARQVLDHQRVGGLWLAPEDHARLSRRAEILAAVRNAAALEHVLETGRSANPLLAAAAEKRAESQHLPRVEPARAHFNGFSLHMLGSQARARRILQQAYRTACLVQWILEGELKLPQPRAHEIVMFRSREAYQQAVDLAMEQTRLTEEDARTYRRYHGYDDPRGFEVFWFYREEEATAWLARKLLGENKSFPPLWEGMLNFASMHMLGTWMPRSLDIAYERIDFGTIEIIFDAGGVHPRIYYEGDKADDDTRLAWAGREGGHRWLRYLDRYGRSRPWEVTFGESTRDLGGNRLLKSSAMAEMLLEDGPLKPTLEKLPVSGSQREQMRNLVEKELGNLGDLERRLKIWLEPFQVPLAERLRLLDKDYVDDEVREFLKALHEARKQATHQRHDVPRWEVAWDRNLSLGARAHARYLAQHGVGDPTREDPTKAGYTAAGDRASRHALIRSGVQKPENALQAMLGSYPDRCRLLDPGLLRVGVALHEGHLVVDSSSVVEPSFAEWRIRWPVRDQTDVPTRYGDGPSPVPGTETTSLGYPITLQTGQRQIGSTLRVQMSLFEVGRRDLVPVDCHFLSPEGGPPGMAMPRTFCLVPKAPLQSRTTYEVKVVFPEDREDLTWQFKTGR